MFNITIYYYSINHFKQICINQLSKFLKEIQIQFLLYIFRYFHVLNFENFTTDFERILRILRIFFLLIITIKIIKQLNTK